MIHSRIRSINNRMLLRVWKLHLAASALLVPDSWKDIDACDVLLVRHDFNCGYTYRGRAYAHLIDTVGDLAAERGLSVASVARSYSRLAGSRAHYSPVTLNRAWFLADVIERALKLTRISRHGIPWTQRRLERIWSRILGRARPICVIAILPDPYLCRAAKRAGIRVMELQHGVIADDNPYYGEPYRRDTPRNDLPDTYLCWDRQSAKVLERWAVGKGIEVRVVGNPWFARFIEENPDDVLVAEALSEGLDLPSDSEGTILVSLQWGMEDDPAYPVSHGVMAQALEDTIRETADRYTWLLRLHPVQLRWLEGQRVMRYLSKTFGDLGTVDWEATSRLPLPIVLRTAEAHVTDSSTVAVEATWFGLRSALLNTEIRPGGKWSTLYAEERINGTIEVLRRDPSAIQSWIKLVLSDPEQRTPVLEGLSMVSTLIDDIAGQARRRSQG